MDARAWASAVVLVVAFGLSGATCKSGQAPSADASAPSEASGAETDEGEASSGLMETRGDACGRDPECSGYLRCIDAICRIPPAVDGRAGGSTPRISFRGEDGSEIAEFYIELADTPAERRRGLMYRREMADGWGMLFVYPDEAERSFWMKNTYLALDMVFIDAAGKVVNILESVPPMTLNRRPSEGPARYVLELNAGVAEARGLEAGMTIELTDVPDAHRPTR